MHLVHKGMAKEVIPATLSAALVPPSKRKTSIPGGVPVLPGMARGGTGSGRNTPVMRSDSPALKVINSFFASGEFCLLMTFANSLDPDHIEQP